MGLQRLILYFKRHCSRNIFRKIQPLRSTYVIKIIRIIIYFCLFWQIMKTCSLICFRFDWLEWDQLFLFWFDYWQEFNANFLTHLHWEFKVCSICLKILHNCLEYFLHRARAMMPDIKIDLKGEGSKKQTYICLLKRINMKLYLYTHQTWIKLLAEILPKTFFAGLLISLRTKCLVVWASAGISPFNPLCQTMWMKNQKC